jgi:hypothetical protein
MLIQFYSDKRVICVDQKDASNDRHRITVLLFEFPLEQNFLVSFHSQRSTRLHQDSRRLRIPSLVPIHNVKELRSIFIKVTAVQRNLTGYQPKTERRKIPQRYLRLMKFSSFSC